LRTWIRQRCERWPTTARYSDGHPSGSCPLQRRAAPTVSAARPVVLPLRAMELSRSGPEPMKASHLVSDRGSGLKRSTSTAQCGMQVVHLRGRAQRLQLREGNRHCPLTHSSTGCYSAALLSCSRPCRRGSPASSFLGHRRRCSRTRNLLSPAHTDAYELLMRLQMLTCRQLWFIDSSYERR
jgi:hypothetical protein